LENLHISTLKAPFGGSGAAYRSGLFKITNAAITPGIQPQRVNRNTITTEPQPLSMTESGGKITAKITRKQPIIEFQQL